MATGRAKRGLALACAGWLAIVSAGPARAEDGTMTITLVGQSMIRADLRVDAPEAMPTIKALVKGDAAFTNFEAMIYDPAQGQTTRMGRFASPPGAMETLQALGFTMLSTANNHAFDGKVPGILNTLTTAERIEIAHAGTGRTMADAQKPYIVNTPKGRIAFIALASGLIGDGRATEVQPGVNELRVEGDVPDPADVKRILDQVRAARKEADIVIVSQHNHLYSGVQKPADFIQLLLSELPERLAPPAWMKPWARQLVDAGADVLAFHGPPFLHGLEIYKGKPVFYSLGNFIFQVPPESIQLEEPIMWESVVATLDFTKGKLAAIRFQPIAQNKIGKGMPNPHDQFDVNLYHRTRGLPKPATGRQAQYLLERFAAFSKVYGTKIAVKDGTATLVLPRGK